MPSSLYPLGPAHLLLRQRGQSSFFYFGTTVTAPEITAERFTTPVTTDFIGPVPLNRVYHGEVHTFTAILNVFDFTVYNRLRGRGDPGALGLRRGDWNSWVGNLVVPVEDYEMLILYDLPHSTGNYYGRLYFSASPVRFRETTENNRVIEVGIVIECTPLYIPLNDGFKAEDRITIVPGSTTKTPSSTKPTIPSSKAPNWLSTESMTWVIGASVVNGVVDALLDTSLSVGSRRTDPTKPSTIRVGGGVLVAGFIGGKLVADTVNSPVHTGSKALMLFSEFPADWSN